MSYHIGVDVGGTNAKFYLFAGRETLFGPLPVKTQDVERYDELLERFQATIDVVVSSEKVRPEEVESVNWGIPGTLHVEENRVIQCPNLSVLDGTRFVLDMEERLGKNLSIRAPNAMDNDANCFALGAYETLELRGSAVAFIFGTGVGGGIVDEKGRLFSGFEASAGEFGRMPYNLQRTYEDLCSGRSLECTLADGRKVDGKELFRLVLRRDSVADATAREFVTKNVASLVRVVDAMYKPDNFIFGGSVSNVIAHYFEDLKKVVWETGRTPELYVCTDPGVNAYGASLLYRNRQRSLTPSKILMPEVGSRGSVKEAR